MQCCHRHPGTAADDLNIITSLTIILNDQSHHDEHLMMCWSQQGGPLCDG